jgi:uncharacterized protein (TIGR04255 family)
MFDEIKYNHPPIVEVVCEFRFAPSSSWDAAVPGLIYSQISADYPKRKRVRVFETQMNPDQSGFQQQVHLVDRVQFLREDEKAFIQIGTDLLAINHVAPYPSWEEFRPLIAQAFKTYQDVAKPTGVVRAGLRYINVVDFSQVSAEKIVLKDYFKFYPEFGQVIPEVAEFMMGAVSTFENGRDALRLQMANADAALTPDPQAPGLRVLLDMDYYLQHPQTVSIETALDWVDSAHHHVLQTFESCLTDKMREVFSPRTS